MCVGVLGVCVCVCVCVCVKGRLEKGGGELTMTQSLAGMAVSFFWTRKRRRGMNREKLFVSAVSLSRERREKVSELQHKHTYMTNSLLSNEIQRCDLEGRLLTQHST